MSFDVRFGRIYNGPADPCFREDTLAVLADALRHDYSIFDDTLGWRDICEALRLHRASSSEEASKVAVRRLTDSPTHRELEMLCAWLGKDRPSRRQAGLQPSEAIEEAFAEEYGELMKKIERALKEPSPRALAAVGNAVRLRQLLEACESAEDIADAEGDRGSRSALHFAAFHSKVDCIEAIVEAAERLMAAEEVLDWQDKQGRTALHVAVRHGSQEAIKALLRGGANPEAVAPERGTPLHLAVHSACMSREDMWRVKCLLEWAHGLDVDAAGDESLDGLTPLHIAVRAADIEVITLLLEARANVNAKTLSGDTALHMAASMDDLDVAELLLSRGASVQERNEDNQTALELAQEADNEEMIDLLTERERLARLASRSGRRLTSSLSSKNEPLEPLEEGQEACVICLARERQVILAPCGHRILCKTCLRALMVGPRQGRKCPMDKEQIESFVTRVYG